jgi:hypothetical protein
MSQGNIFLRIKIIKLYDNVIILSLYVVEAKRRGEKQKI